MDLSIIIVSWNVRELLEKCLKSVFDQTKNISLEVFVVDNASTDETARMVLEKFPQVTLIKNNKNMGFAVGNNQAIRLAKGEYILLLNPDTEILNGAIERMVGFMQSHPEAGIAGPKLLNSDKTLQPSIRLFPRLIDQILIFLKIPHIWPNLGPLKRYYALDFDYTGVSEADQVMGAFFLVRREVFNKIGLLDEKFFIWFEEVDFCRRARQAGYKIMYNPDAQVIHYGGQSFGRQMTIVKQWRFLRSMIRYFWKHH